MNHQETDLTVQPVSFPVTFYYKLSQIGQKASLLAGGDGRNQQTIFAEVPEDKLEFCKVQSNGNLTDCYLQSRQELKNPNGTLYLGCASIHEFDSPLTPQQALEFYLAQKDKEEAQQEKIAAHNKQLYNQAARRFLENPEARAEAFEQDFTRVKIDDPELGLIWLDQTGVVELANLRRQADLQQKTLKETQEQTEKWREELEKAEFIALWVTNNGNTNQKERLAANLLPDEEIIEIVKTVTFAPLDGFPEYEKILFADVQQNCDEFCESNYINCEVVNARYASRDEWQLLQQMKSLLPAASFTLRTHTSKCENCETGMVKRNDIYAEIKVGPFTFNKEFSVAKKETPKYYAVVVGNLGTVYAGEDETVAKGAFNEYVKNSKNGYGRAADEDVTLFVNGEIEDEFEGRISKLFEADSAWQAEDEAQLTAKTENLKPCSIDTLLNNAEKLSALLRQPELRLFSWHDSLAGAIDRIAQYSPYYKKPE